MTDTDEKSRLEGMQALGQLASWQMMAAAVSDPVHPKSMQANHPPEFVPRCSDGRAVTDSLKATASAPAGDRLR